MTPTSPTAFRQNPRVAYRPVGDGTGVLLNLETGAYHSVNATGRSLWDAIGNGSTVEELASSLAALYGLSRDEATRDVESFVADLSERQLLLTD